MHDRSDMERGELASAAAAALDVFLAQCEIAVEEGLEPPTLWEEFGSNPRLLALLESQLEQRLRDAACKA